MRDIAMKKVRVMISSRCLDKFPNGSDEAPCLSSIRSKAKEKIEAVKIFGKKCFEVWINEDAPPNPGSEDSWELCLSQVKSCDVLLVLYNGNAGWAKTDGDIGICHAELMTGLAHAPGKVFLVSIFDKDGDGVPSEEKDKRFQQYVDSQNLFRGGNVATTDQLLQRIYEAIHEGLISLARRGVREASKGKFHTGAALDWSRMDFTSRSRAMVETVSATIRQRDQASQDTGPPLVKIGRTKITTVASAIPAAFTVAAARELVGQPFLKDHEVNDDSAGPIHMIACHKGVTESQAVSLLGFPDATIVTTPFGVYAVDNVQKIQLVLIAHCRDETTTIHGVQRFFDWLEQTGEDKNLAERARSRRRIVKAIAKEVNRKSK